MLSAPCFRTALLLQTRSVIPCGKVLPTPYRYLSTVAQRATGATMVRKQARPGSTPVHTSVIPFSAPDVLNHVQGALEAHGVFALPTDTVYGLACRYDDAAAIRALYHTKGRPGHKALPVLLGDKAHLPLVTQPSSSALVRRLTEQFWPGPMTLVLEAHPDLGPDLLAGGSTVAVRVVDNPVFQTLANRFGPLATSSANLSGHPDCSDAAAVRDQLQGRIPLIVDGGPTRDVRPSTIVSVHREQITILREGSLSAAIRAIQAERNPA